eukprot:GDKI01034008.1.p1 GENE.GDKI01034008.1~~GDKI01034008.1.p1  ORF type:complete len:146 (-),score=53.61 GDKI01034008.1:233-670(-)
MQRFFSCAKTMLKTQVNCATAPKAIGPYSQAIKANGMVFTAGQLGIRHDTMDFESKTDVQVQTKRALENLQAVLKEAGSDMKHVVKTNVFLHDMGDFARMNEIYGQYFNQEVTGSPAPARSTVAVKTLPKEALVEIEAVAVVPAL